MPAKRPRVFISEEPAVSPIDLPISSRAETYQPEPPAEFRDELPVLGSLREREPVETVVPVTLQLSQELYDEYVRVAAAQELTLEEVLQHRLASCRSHNALRGLWFTDSERGLLENLLQKWPLESAKQALELISRAASIKFDDLEIILTPAQKRVLSLSNFRGSSPKSFFEGLIRKELKA